LAEIAKSPDEARARVIATQPTPQQQTTEDANFQSFATAISKIDANTRLKIAQQLKKAGLYRGKPTAKFNNSLYDALLAAEERRAKLASITEVPGRLEFIQGLAVEGEAGGTGGPTKQITTRVSDDTTLRAMAIEVLKAKTGDEGTEAEINDLVKKAKRAQAKNPTVTTYTTSDGVTKTSTTGGIDAGQFMIDIVAKTDDARANKVLQAYNIALNTFGGLR
jgi:hypothetical protein